MTRLALPKPAIAMPPPAQSIDVYTLDVPNARVLWARTYMHGLAS